VKWDPGEEQELFAKITCVLFEGKVYRIDYAQSRSFDRIGAAAREMSDEGLMTDDIAECFQVVITAVRMNVGIDRLERRRARIDRGSRPKRNPMTDFTRTQGRYLSSLPAWSARSTTCSTYSATPTAVPPGSMTGDRSRSRGIIVERISV
jgi:hypothetical protein